MAVVEFPCEFNERTMLADSMSALDQIDAARYAQEHWADNAVSVTVTFREEELDDIKAKLADVWPTTKSISFLLYSGHGFDQAPLSPISEGEYYDRLADIDMRHETVVGHSSLDEADCEGGACPIR